MTGGQDKTGVMSHRGSAVGDVSRLAQQPRGSGRQVVKRSAKIRDIIGVEEMKYAVSYEKTATGYSAYAPDLRGCIAAGRTLRQTEKLMREAIELHLRAITTAA